MSPKHQEEQTPGIPVVEQPPRDPTTPDPATEMEKFRDLALRARADFDNYRKRAAREKEDAIRYANSSLLEQLLPVLDNFELGLEAARGTTDGDSILQGLDMVRRQFADLLAGAGVEEILTDGVEFDPNLMEAVGHEADDNVPEGHVLRRMRRGYKLRDRLLRPASVSVSKGPAMESAS